MQAGLTGEKTAAKSFFKDDPWEVCCLARPQARLHNRQTEKIKSQAADLAFFTPAGWFLLDRRSGSRRKIWTN